jgi:glycosyltransferase involved in cell wall biosynthesis
MRVCMIVRNPCVRDARVLREAATLASADNDVTVLATAEPGVPNREERDGFRIVRIEPVPRIVRRISGRAPIPTQQANAPRTSSDPKGRPPLFVTARDLIVTRELTRAALAIPSDAYHAHDLNTLAAGVRAARTHRARLVYDAHELYPELTGLGEAERARWARLETKLIHTPDAVVTPSESRADEMARRYGIARPDVVMNCPPASSAPDPNAGPVAALRRPGETLLVYSGGYTVNRGLENIVRAMSQLDGFRLAMLGYGSLEGELRALARDADGRVEFVAPVEPEDVVAAVAGADIGLASYLPIGLNNKLAAPNKLWEYLHAGLAVAGTDLPDIRYVVNTYEVGALFDSADPSSIANAVRDIARDPAGLAAMRRRARDTAPLYTWERQAETLLGIYARFAA